MLIAALSSGQKTGILIVAASFIAFALASAILIPRYLPNFPGKSLRLYVVVAAALTVGMLAAIVVGAKEPKEEREPVAETTAAATTATEPGPGPEGDAAAGKAVFAKAGCVSCHTLKAAGASGTVGPNLDEAKPPAARVIDRVTNGKGVMPSFKGQLSPEDIQNVAAFVAASVGG